MDETKLTTLELVRTVRLLQRQVDALMGESCRVTLTSEDRRRAVALSQIHPSSGYFVHMAVLEQEGGSVGELQITQKRRNGFFLNYTGDARQVVVDLWIHDRPNG